MWRVRTEIKPQAFSHRKADRAPAADGRARGDGSRSPDRVSGGSTAIASSHTRRLLAALPLTGALIVGAASVLAAEAPPTPAPRPGAARAVDGAVQRSIAVVPRPQLPPDSAPTPAKRPESDADDAEMTASPAPPDAPPAQPAPPLASTPPEAVAPPVEAAPLDDLPAAAESAPAPEAGESPAPAAPAPPEARPEPAAPPEAPAPVDVPAASDAPAADTGPIGPPAPARAGPGDVPLARPAFEAPPKPPLDDQSVATRDAFGPPKANPLMADRQCVFAPAAHAVFSLKPEIETEEGCGIENPVRLESVGDDPKISFVDPPIFSCAFANAMADFLVGDVERLAARHLDAPVVEVGPGTSYACRGRNNDAHAKLSEHAFGNAFDLQALRLANGTFLTVVGGWNTGGAEKDFWRALHAAACERFKTVLGPNANKLHEDHFHLDMARRNRGYALCE